MRATVVLVLCLTSVLSSGQERDPAEASAIRDVVKQYVDAREKRDAAAIRALFTEDADQLTSSGEWRRGREDVVRGTLASSQTNSGTRTITIETVRFPARDVALADGQYTIAGNQTTGTRNMRTSFVLVRTAGAWRISAIRNMLPAPPAQ
jgi:uncharacterized protein (TIGR02246 family)